MARLTGRSVSALLLAAAGSLLVYGQGFTASVLGTVSDNTGAVVPQVTVTVTNKGTGIQTVAKTGESGAYTVPQLQPGEYTVAAEISGFKRSVRDNVTLQVDTRQVIDFKLELGQVSENVTVTAETSAIQTETATVGAAVTHAQTSELPLNGRAFLQLNLLVPGAAPPVKGSQLSTQGGSISVHGLPENQNFFWVDGVDNTTMAIGQYVVNPPPYTVEEFRVMSPTYDAEFGRNPGAQINVITRSGGNTYHGDVYLFIRNSVFDAKNYFDPAGPIPSFRRGQYGGDFGGKIIRDKLFFYGAYEGLTYAQGESASAIVPSHQNTLGNFSDISTKILDPTTGVQFPGNIIPQNRINPAGAAYAAFYPAPNGGANTLLVSPTGDNTDNVTVGKADWVVSQKNRLGFRYAFETITYHQPIAQFSNQTNIPGFGLNNLAAHNITTGLSDTYTFTPALIGEFRLGWNKWSLQYHAQANDKDYCALFNIQGCRQGAANWYPPSVSLNSTYATLGGGNNQYGPFDTTFIDPTVTWIKGRHQMKFGWDFHKFLSNYIIGVGPGGSFTFRGTFSGNPLSDLLLGLPYQASITTIINGDAQFLLQAKQTALFFQDDFKFTPHLTFNVGLRYDYQFANTEKQNRLANLDLTNGVANATRVIAGQNGVGRTVYGSNPNEYSPRVGFAWSPRSNWVVRGGIGIFFQTLTINNTLSLRQNPPFQNAYTVVGDGKNITINNAFVTGLTGNVPNFTVYPQHIKYGYVEQWSIGVQHAITPTIIFDGGYVGNRGRDIDGSLAVNAPLPGAGVVQNRRPNVNYATISDYGALNTSQYDGLEIRVDKKFSGSSHIQASYTYSHALDNTGPQNPYDLTTGWGPSGYDIRQHLALNYVYGLPIGKGRKFLGNVNRFADYAIGGWQLNGIVQMRSGQPFTATLSQDNINNLVNNGWPNVIGDPYQSSATCQTRTPTCWVNPAAFAAPALYTFGNETKGFLRGPSLYQWDSSLTKNFRFGEQRKVEFRAEAFNILNHPNFDNPSTVLSSTFGRITSATAGSARQMQFGARFVF